VSRKHYGEAAVCAPDDPMDQQGKMWKPITIHDSHIILDKGAALNGIWRSYKKCL
jgi:hypothetical protein